MPTKLTLKSRRVVALIPVMSKLHLPGSGTACHVGEVEAAPW
jgi:hypothetical protein